jgi:hypothetical protein
MDNIGKIGVLAVMIIVAGMSSQAFGQNQEDYQYQARLQYCYDLYADISDDFGWWWQKQKKTVYNANCGELLGYISED